MSNRLACIAGFAVLMFFCGRLAAEVPPLPKEELESGAALIVTGKVTKVAVEDRKPSGNAVAREREYRLTVAVADVAKGKLQDPAKPVVAAGSYYELKPGMTGTGGHRSANTTDRISAVKEGWELKLYLKPAKDGVHEIVFPNGFEVQKKPEAKKDPQK
jgi:hypothetical protein